MGNIKIISCFLLHWMWIEIADILEMTIIMLQFTSVDATLRTKCTGQLYIY